MLQKEGVEDDAEREEAQAEVGKWGVRLLRLGLERETASLVNGEGSSRFKFQNVLKTTRFDQGPNLLFNFT